MTYTGHVKNGIIVLDPPAAFPNGTLVEVSLLEEVPLEPQKSFHEWISALADSIPQEAVDRAPADGSINHDHYLYGTRKCEA